MTMVAARPHKSLIGATLSNCTVTIIVVPSDNHIPMSSCQISEGGSSGSYNSTHSPIPGTEKPLGILEPASEQTRPPKRKRAVCDTQDEVVSKRPRTPSYTPSTEVTGPPIEASSNTPFVPPVDFSDILNDIFDVPLPIPDLIPDKSDSSIPLQLDIFDNWDTLNVTPDSLGANLCEPYVTYSYPFIGLFQEVVDFERVDPISMFGPLAGSDTVSSFLSVRYPIDVILSYPCYIGMLKYPIFRFLLRKTAQMNSIKQLPSYRMATNRSRIITHHH